MATITFSNNINVSAQVGDILFYHTFAGDPGTKLGAITAIGSNFVEIDNANIGGAAIGNFFSFKKSNGVFEDDNGNEIGYYHSNSSIKGYYAKVKITNTQSTKKELFYLGSEITESSK
tara:strand:- start:10714 stop:11067 length:354 start_codon:yes stop_codon:yes gene_type:complete